MLTTIDEDGFRSYWRKSATGTSFSPLQADTECDVAVVGAGIVGLTAALRLSGEGAKVALLEARQIGAGTTGYTTAMGTSAGTALAALALERENAWAKTFDPNRLCLRQGWSSLLKHNADDGFRFLRRSPPQASSPAQSRDR